MRYLCVYYAADRLADVNKNTKKVVVIDTDDPKVVLTVENELKIVHKTKYIKYIRNLAAHTIHYNNHELRRTEERNNFSIIT